MKENLADTLRPELIKKLMIDIGGLGIIEKRGISLRGIVYVGFCASVKVRVV